MNRVLYIGRYNQSEELTGPEKFAKRIFQESSKLSNTDFVEYFFNGSVYGIRKKLFGFEIVEASGNSTVYRIGLLRLLPFLIKKKPQVIHILTFERFAILVYFLKIFTKIKIVINVHGVAAYENVNFKNVSFSLKWKDSFVEKFFYKFSDKLFFLSKYSLDIARKYYNVPDKRVGFVLNGVDEKFKLDGIKKFENDIPKLLFIGDSDRKDKDFNFLYSSLDKIKHSCHLYLIGKFNDSLYSRKVGVVQIQNVNYMDSYSLVKFLSDKDIYISSSYSDTFSIAAIECMSLGIPSIISDKNGASNLITNYENGFVIKHGDVKDLSDKINLLVEDEKLRSKISKKSSEIYETLKWENIYATYQNIYKGLV